MHSVLAKMMYRSICYYLYVKASREMAQTNSCQQKVLTLQLAGYVPNPEPDLQVKAWSWTLPYALVQQAEGQKPVVSHEAHSIGILRELFRLEAPTRKLMLARALQVFTDLMPSQTGERNEFANLFGVGEWECKEKGCNCRNIPLAQVR